MVCQGNQTIREARPRCRARRHGHRIGVVARPDRQRSEIASLSGSGLVQAALQGADTVIISAAINGFIFKVFGAPEITIPAQLKGKKLGVSRYGATSDFAVRLALRKWGLNPDRDVSILQIGTSQDTVRAMQAKMLDAGLLSGTASLIARKAGFRRAGGPRRPRATLPDGAHRHDEIFYPEKRRARERIHARLHRSDPRFQAQQRSRPTVLKNTRATTTARCWRIATLVSQTSI